MRAVGGSGPVVVVGWRRPRTRTRITHARISHRPRLVDSTQIDTARHDNDRGSGERPIAAYRFVVASYWSVWIAISVLGSGMFCMNDMCT